MASKTVLITGANTGIGYEIVRALCGSEAKYNIIVAGRSPEKVEAAISSAKQEFPSTSSELFPVQIDLESDESIQKAFKEVKEKFGKLDVLVNNAGGQFDLEYVFGKSTEREMWNKSWNVNVAGTQVLTSTFIPLLLAGTNPRILFVTSGTATLAGHEDPKIAVNASADAGWPKQGLSIPAYRSAKTGLNMMMREWYRLLKNDGVQVFSLSPGFLATGLGIGDPEKLKAMGAQSPEVAGGFVRSVIDGERDGDSGKVLARDGVQDW